MIQDVWRTIRHWLRRSPDRYPDERSSQSRQLVVREENWSLGQSRHQPRGISWVLPGILAVGELPRPGDELRLARENIQAILSLCAPEDGLLPATMQRYFDCRFYFLPDSRYLQPIQVQELAEVARIIRYYVEHRLPLYVHCLAGRERSVLACMAYLCYYHNLDTMAALMHLKQVHSPASPTGAQLKVLQSLVVALKRDRYEAANSH